MFQSQSDSCCHQPKPSTSCICSLRCISYHQLTLSKHSFFHRNFTGRRLERKQKGISRARYFAGVLQALCRTNTLPVSPTQPNVGSAPALSCATPRCPLLSPASAHVRFQGWGSEAGHLSRLQRSMEINLKLHQVLVKCFEILWKVMSKKQGQL